MCVRCMYVSNELPCLSVPTRPFRVPVKASVCVGYASVTRGVRTRPSSTAAHSVSATTTRATTMTTSCVEVSSSQTDLRFLPMSNKYNHVCSYLNSIILLPTPNTSWGVPIELFLIPASAPQSCCNKGRGICYPVCGMVHIKEPLLLIRKSSPCGGRGFPLSI